MIEAIVMMLKVATRIVSDILSLMVSGYVNTLEYFTISSIALTVMACIIVFWRHPNVIKNFLRR